MGLFDTLNPFSPDKQSQDTNRFKTTTGESTRDITREGTETTTQTGSKVSEQTGLVSGETLSPEIQALLSELVTNITGERESVPIADTAIAGQDLAGFLTERAKETEAFVSEASTSIIEDARRTGERALGSNVTAAQRAANSGLNSLVALRETEGRAALESKLGDLEGQLKLAGRQLESEDLSRAAAAINAAVGSGATAGSNDVANITALAQVLKGATTTTETEQAATEDTQLNAVIESLNKILEEREFSTEEVGNISQRTEDDRDLFDVLGLF